MKKIITFAVILGVLTGGILYYAMRKMEDQSKARDLKSLPTEISVNQGQWKDILVPDKEEIGRVYRKANTDYATIVSLTDDTLVLDWDNWGTETFKKDKNNVWTRIDNAK